MLWKLSRNKGGASKWLREHALVYLDYYNDFGYDFETNGERTVIERPKPFSPKLVFDVGANVGDWAKMAAQAFPESIVHSFELSDSTRQVLSGNLQGPRFVVASSALGSREETITYKDYGDLSTVNTITNSMYHDARTSHTLRSAKLEAGDRYLERIGADKVDLLKIDVEGAEYAVLKGFEKALRNEQIRVIQFEYGYANGDAGNLMKDFYALLSEAGYQIGRVWSAGVQFSNFEYRMNNFDSGPNYIAVAKTESRIIEALRSDQ